MEVSDARPLRFTLLGRHGPRDLAAALEPTVTAGALADLLGVPALCGEAGPMAPDQPATHQGLRDGGLLGHGVPVAARPDRPELVLLVTAGQAAGSAYPLRPGRLVVGTERPGACQVDVRLADPGGGGPLLALEVGPDRAVTATPLGPGLRLDGEPVDDAVRWAPEAMMEVGDGGTVLTIAAAPVAAAVQPGQDGTTCFHRPPRMQQPDALEHLDVPLPPQPRESTRIPLLAVLAPLVLAGALFAWNPGAPQYLLFALLSPAMVLGTAVGDRRGARRDLRDGMARYAAACDRYDEAARQLRLRQEQAARDRAPDPATLGRWADLPGARIWERRPGAPEWLRLRVGTTERPAEVELRGRSYGLGARPVECPAPDDARPPLLRLVPVTVDLPAVGVLGIEGAGRLAAARWLLGQVAALHPPGEARIDVLSDEPEAWTWLRWLPHRVRIVGGGEAAGVVAHLTREASRRGSSELPRTWRIVVADGPRCHGLPAWGRLLREGPAAGVLVICLAADARSLSGECRAVVHAGGSSACLEVHGQPVQPLRLDEVDAAWAERLARALAPLRLLTGDEASAQGLPTRLRWRAVAEPFERAQLAARWADRTRDSTAVVLGATPTGPWVLDLAVDGPHALVAGTTGSGKSELLQTWIAALACASPPTALTFLLVDYKGGAAFGRCADLPHAVGLLTDLDPAETARALASLGAELRRREALLAERGARDLTGYHRAGGTELPRLVIVVDEFAALAEELPEFVTGLVGIAQRGRSLGVHLILATQRPGGVVSAEIRANSAIRICLRVTDAAESLDVVDTRDAAQLPAGCPGRAVLRTPSGTSTVQAGWLGGSDQPEPADRARRPRAVWDLADWTGADPHEESTGRMRAGYAGADAPASVQTDLDAVVEEVTAAASSFERPSGPWLPPLPETLHDSALPAGPSLPARPGAVPAVPVGRLDLPQRQAQPTLHYDLVRSGTLLVIGAPRSGRSTALRTIVAGLVRVATPDDVHVHLLDPGGSLQDLAGLPHVGVVTGASDVERLLRLVDRLVGEVRRRRATLAGLGHPDLAAWRAADPGAAPPYLLLGVDGWHALAAALDEVDHGSTAAALLGLLQDGPAAGLRAVVTSDRTALTGRISGLADHRWLLRLADRADWGLAGVPISRVPSRLAPGRCLVVGDPDHGADPVECQLLAGSGLPNPTVSTTPVRRRPLRLDPLPATIGWREARRLQPHRPDRDASCGAVVGVGGDRLGLVTADPSDGFLVVGPPGSGRSNALDVIERSLRDAGRQVVRPRGDLPAASAVPAGSVILIDDLELLGEAASGWAETLAGSGEPLVAAVTADAAHTAFRGVVPALRRARRGLLLSPRRLDGDLLGVTLRGDLVGAAAGSGPGRAVLVDRGRVQLVQVPLLDRG